MKPIKIAKDVLDIIDEGKVEKNLFFLPDKQLSRDLYIRVNKVLETIGGKWNRKSRAHVFNEDPTELINNVIVTGEYTDEKKEYQFFETPSEMVERMIQFADIIEGQKILEPSAGRGAIAYALTGNGTHPNINVHCIELNPVMARELCDTFETINADFLTVKPNNTYDAVIMNPPFSNQQDIDHVLHAFDFLTDDGVLISVVSEGPFFRMNKKSIQFRKWLEDNNAEIYNNDPGAFSDTMVKTRIIVIRKGERT